MRISDPYIIELSQYVDFFKPYEILKHVSRLKEGEVSLQLEEMVERLLLIKGLGKDSSSLKSYILRYGDTLGKIKWENKTEKCKFNKAKILDKYGEDGLKMLRNRGASEEIYIERYGSMLGKQKWEEYKTKRNSTYKRKKAEGKDYNSFSIEKYINKYGEDEGKLKYAKMIENRIYKTTKLSLIEKYGKEEAELIAKDRWNNTSLRSFIKRYGEDEGKLKYDEHIKKLKNQMSFDYLIKTYGEEEGTKKYINKCWKQNNGSKIATDLFTNVVNETGLNANFGTNESVIFLTKRERDKSNQKVIFPDFCYGTKIIEFYGDMWHANPTYFSDDEYPNPFQAEMKSTDIREKDKQREEILRSKGYEVLIIWESEYKTNKMSTILKCVNFLRE